MIPLIYEVSIVVKFIETENRIVVARGWGLEEDKELLICNFSFAK